jgi:predicted RNase H-like HicB family nuclease
MTLKEALKLKYEIVLTPSEGWWVAGIPELPGCLTQGKTQEIALKRLNEAKHIWLKEAIKNGMPFLLPEDYYAEGECE